jgi:hypothetical protein
VLFLMKGPAADETVAVHPKDDSTDFLKPIYGSLSSVLVCSGGKSRAEVAALCKSAKSIFCVGHGTQGGLMAVGAFPNELFIVDESFLQAFKHKNLFLVWCNADVWVERTKVKKVFFSGMFVSETDEASLESLPPDKEAVQESNAAFAAICAKHIQLFLLGKIQEFHTVVTSDYRVVGATNPIAAFNCERLYFKK